MKPAHHMVISGGVTLLFACWVKSKLAIAACFLSGIFIDLDHFLDYFIARRRITLNYRKFYDFFARQRRSKLLIVFHAYEWLFILWISIFYFSLDAVWIGLAVGLTTHILCDEIFNPLKPLAYFITYRIAHKFDCSSLYKRDYFNEAIRQ